MNEKELTELITAVAAKTTSVEEAITKIKALPFVDLTHTRLDTHRKIRNGQSEVIFAQGKQIEHLIESIGWHLNNNAPLLATRVSPEQASILLNKFPQLVYKPEGSILLSSPKEHTLTTTNIAIVTAGTSDIAVAEECAITAEFFGSKTEKIYDVGVAGIHRLLAHVDTIRKARVVVAIAGMEAALASVVGGLVDKPVIAVPTSTGYGTGLGGFSAMLGMLNSCSSNVCTVNIDNGFGAGYLASMINKM